MWIWEATVSHICKGEWQEKSGTCKRLFAKLWGLLIENCAFFLGGGALLRCGKFQNSADTIHISAGDWNQELSLSCVSDAKSAFTDVNGGNEAEGIFTQTRDLYLYICGKHLLPSWAVLVFLRQRIFGTEFFRGGHCSSGTLSDRFRTTENLLTLIEIILSVI